jgi:hypothetical protein
LEEAWVKAYHTRPTSPLLCGAQNRHSTFIFGIGLILFYFPSQLQNGSLSLYLYQLISLEYVLVKNFTNLPTTDGKLVTTVDDSWFLSKLPAGSPNVTYTYYIYLIASGLDPSAEQKNINSIYREESIGTLNFTLIRKYFMLGNRGIQNWLASWLLLETFIT